MYTKEEREGILWEFHRSGLSVKRACETLPLFPERGGPQRVAEAGEGRRARGDRDAGQGLAHALRPREGRPGPRPPRQNR